MLNLSVAHFIKLKIFSQGTEIYDAKRGSFVDLEILDVLQIFGRAGRPQFDKSGHGTIITTHDKLSHYLSTLTNQYHIESNFISCLVDNLNAEVCQSLFTYIHTPRYPAKHHWTSSDFLILQISLAGEEVVNGRGKLI